MSLQIEFLDENPLSTLVPVHTLQIDRFSDRQSHISRPA